jgi:hypothetical protein
MRFGNDVVFSVLFTGEKQFGWPALRKQCVCLLSKFSMKEQSVNENVLAFVHDAAVRFTPGVCIYVQHRHHVRQRLRIVSAQAKGYSVVVGPDGRNYRAALRRRRTQPSHKMNGAAFSSGSLTVFDRFFNPWLKPLECCSKPRHDDESLMKFE